ncbi:MAG: SGNH/GDSL hydrolase family protein [Bacteroidales bacterium]|nr:SGNH/GDSL hydrolase family protein [Bacteroidales bacterium]
MKRIFIFLIAAALTVSATAANLTPKNAVYSYKEASELTLVGKLMPGMTENPYHRIDTTRYKGFTKKENLQVRMTSGMGCVFKTNSTSIRILTDFAYASKGSNTNLYSAQGYDLYILQDGKWLWAASGVHNTKHPEKPLTIIRNMDGSEHTCLLYFPLYSSVNSIQIGVEEDASLKKVPNPFRHRIAIFGSSYTHGSSTSRPGMAYPAQFSRHTGLQMLSLGCSGNSKLQSYFCTALCDVDADAFVFDAFSNPSAKQIRERLMPFIDRLVEAHPGKPLIFQQTIYREARNFNTAIEEKERDRAETARKMMDALKGNPKYKDVYYIIPSTGDSHENTVDGTHPDNHGYTLWAESIEPQILEILAKYGIK